MGQKMQLLITLQVIQELSSHQLDFSFNILNLAVGVFSNPSSFYSRTANNFP